MTAPPPRGERPVREETADAPADFGPVGYEVASAEGMRAFGERLAAVLRPGDLVTLTGDLGAGKTTLAQGIGAGLGVRGEVTSPTFVIARVHPSPAGGPDLVHVDAYRLSSLAEVDDLDLDASLEDSVTVVEWGAGLVENLSGSRLDIRLTRARGTGATATDRVDDVDEVRTVRLMGIGPRWAGADPALLRADPGPDRGLEGD
jgi:tRNA threonylcarbamoyladenosine biosynthesis protein TsaE